MSKCNLRKILAHDRIMKHHAIMTADILIITGYSGAGKSTVLRALEDIGFFCVDNLPIALLESFYALHAQSQNTTQRVALGIDVRNGQTAEHLMHELEKFKALHTASTVHIIFLSSSMRILVRRFQETRRRHPLAEQLPLTDAIRHEKKLMQPLARKADLLLETDQLTTQQLRNFIRISFAPGGSYTMMVSIVSFGFKYGVPAESNFVYDLRSLPNPYFIPDLRPLTGQKPAVQTYLFSHPDVIYYWEKLHDFVRYTIQKAYQEGRVFIKIAIGCTGGRHRSVAFVERLAQESIPHVHFLVEHRDIGADVKRV
jgi:UPF0042 nucleotide-binding protein